MDDGKIPICFELKLSFSFTLWADWHAGHSWPELTI